MTRMQWFQQHLQWRGVCIDSCGKVYLRGWKLMVYNKKEMQLMVRTLQQKGNI